MKRVNKVVFYDEAAAFFATVRLEGKRIVQCHGTFDLVHPGHIHHLEEAKSLGDVLVVTVTAEKYVNKGPGRPVFNDHLRVKTLASLTMVDYVVLIPFPAATEAIRTVAPHVYCKGLEYADSQNDVTGNIKDDLRVVYELGGEVKFIGSVVFSSSRLINNSLQNLDSGIADFCHDLSRTVSPERFKEYINDFNKLKILVLGDIIIDRYSYVKVQGLTSKNRILSGRYVSQDSQMGGSLAVYRHMKQFCDNVHLMGLVGSDSETAGMINPHLKSGDDLVIRESKFQTIIKERFVEPLLDGKEISKLFSVNYIDSSPPGDDIINRVLEKLSGCIRDYDLVAVTDFGHGLMQYPVRRLVESHAKFMSLNCQTNSNNHGFNIISYQYQRASSFSLDEQELLLSVARRHIDQGAELERLRQRFNASYAWLTRGAVETIGLRTGEAPAIVPPFASTVTDTIGAGDAFYAVTSMAACLNFPVALATFIGQLAGAQAVGIIGNSTPISKEKLLKSGMTMLNY